MIHCCLLGSPTHSDLAYVHKLGMEGLGHTIGDQELGIFIEIQGIFLLETHFLF